MAQNAYFDTPSCRTLRRALSDVGGLDGLAQRIGCDAANAAQWCAGESLPPLGVFLRALDIVARPLRRPIRLAILQPAT